jgi:hypothetical protein
VAKKSHFTVGKKTLDPSSKNLRYELLLNTGQVRDSPNEGTDLFNILEPAWQL